MNHLIGGWQWQGILTAQSGFPFTSLAGSNISGTGTATNPDVLNRNADFKGPVILGRPERWFNPDAFVLPIVGIFGNVPRVSFARPGLTTFDTSLFKSFGLKLNSPSLLPIDFFSMGQKASANASIPC